MALSLKQLPWSAQVGAFVLLSAAGVGAFWYFCEKPARDEMVGRQQRLRELRVEVAKGQNIARKLPEFRAQVEELESRLDGLRAVLPEQKDVGDLLRRIQTLATQSSLEIRGFKPQAIQQKEMHAEWPIAIELAGSYHDLALFFDKVSKVPRIINISNIVIKGRDADRRAERTPVDGAGTISAECLATTFVLSDGPEPTAEPVNARRGAAGAKRSTPAAKAGRS